ncbi:MAG: alpha/beta fold hydrolase [Cyanobacteria bacterium SZAS LIN-2]|nr:alpha/beta fold hydrolase [Cyanobacteria bacterium SZAS LIN-3]MBS1999574.1 alpha/beta fold hydrolase [Cyanobacteria bacterium SZAS LIN-2]
MSKTGADFTPAAGLLNSHLMTLAPLLIPRRFPLTDRESEKLFIEVAPGNQVLIKLHHGRAEGPVPGGVTGDSLIVILHGLESSAEAPYVRGVCEKAIHEGFSVARMNMRNCGGTSHLSQTLYNAGMSQDVLVVATELCRRFGYKRVFLCGFSLGGNVVLKAAGEQPTSHPDLHLSGVCSICPPIDLEGCVRQMEQGVNRIYEKNFVLSLKLKVYEKARHFPGRYDLKKLRKVRTVRAFDDAFTAPDAGYASASDYYSGASAGKFLSKIECPSLIIAAQDDPLVPFSCFEKFKTPGESFRGRLLAPQSGGHVAFIHHQPIQAPSRTGTGGDEGAGGCRDPFWSEWQAVSFFSHCITGGGTL